MSLNKSKILFQILNKNKNVFNLNNVNGLFALSSNISRTYVNTNIEQLRTLKPEKYNKVKH